MSPSQEQHHDQHHRHILEMLLRAAASHAGDGGLEMSEFGTGYAYCLGLFLAHEARVRNDKEVYKKINSDSGPSMWFNASADHLFELQIPEKLPAEKQKEIAEWQVKCLSFRLFMHDEKCTWDDVSVALQYAKDLLRQWDEFCGIKTEKGEWE